MFSLLSVFGICGVALGLYVVGLYLIDSKGLRRFPSPSIAGLTPFWLVYQSSTGQRSKTIDAVHRKLGSEVRISPNHISFTDPKAYKDIYGHGSAILKDEFYTHLADGTPSIAQTTSRAEHSRKRKALARVFSAREITSMEPRVIEVVKKLCRDLHIKSEGGQVADTDAYETQNGVFDLRPWLNMFSYDAIGAMFWSYSYGFLDKGNDLCSSMAPSGKTKEVHAMDSFHSAGRWNVMFAQLPDQWLNLFKVLLAQTHIRQAVSNFGGMARFQVTKRLEITPDEPDLFSHLPSQPSDKWPTPMSLEELVSESGTMLDAGNDTTQTSLTNCIHNLARYPDKQKKLHDILVRSASPRDLEKPVLAYSEPLQHIPYLRACLDESFRVRPPVALGLPRRTVSPGATIAGHFIPPDTTVSVPLYSLHHDESLFKEPWSFVPERWLKDDDGDREGYTTDSDEAKNLRDFCLPFSLGGRACIGRNLAYMELSIVIAALVLGFEWELAVPGSELEMAERFNCNPKELMVRARVRKGVNWVS